MIRPGQRWLALGAVALLAAACGDDPAETGGTPDAGTPPGQSTLLLTRVGPAVITGHRGAAVELTALLSRSELGGVADADVVFRIHQDPGGTELENGTVTTDANGVASTRVILGDEGEIEIRATSGEATSRARWTIKVAQQEKRLRVAGLGPADVSDSGRRGALKTAPNASATLRVKATTVAENGNELPLSGETVTFAFASTIAGASFANGQFSAVTQGDGEASILLNAGTTTGTYQVTAAIPGTPSVIWDVSVQSGGGGDCVTSGNCPSGYSCLHGQCVQSGGGGCGGNDRPCPIGYICSNGTCQLGTGSGCEACPNGYHCDNNINQCVPDNPECDDNVPCPTGFECVNGTCAPGDGHIDVTGHWFTRHRFDVREALPSWVRFSATAIRTIDQVLLGQLNLPSFINSLIRGLVQQYVPEWVVTLVGILDSAFTVFSTLESEGEMELTPVGGPSVLSGEEAWTSFVFYFLPLCNGNIGGNPNNPPPCARMDIYTTELPQSDLAVSVDRFAARVSGSNNNFTVLFDQRRVAMRFQGILKYALDQAISLSTGYDGLQDALPNLVDCEGVNQLVQDLGITFDVTALCQTAVVAAAQAISDQLEQAALTQRDTLEFDGKASARATLGIPSYADELGYADFITRNPPDGEWKAKFKIGISVKNVPGRWRGSRAPLSP